ncbi:hypothetical protein [Streptomyces sp. NPDC014622]|uniref:hypothetical protein n=1 Tax=Streptomyces sp. NPDC014622 TaxID=3364874 RepID=UPI003700A07C
MSAVPWYIKAVLRVALPAACLAALYLSIPGEMDLARTVGWGERYAPAMPVCLSVYALAAGAISGYRRKMKLPGETTALIGGLMALLLAMSAQSISHLIEQSYMTTSALLVVAVSCVPPLTIAHLVHMAETPTQVKTAGEQMGELAETIDFLTVQLTESLTVQTGVLISESGAVVKQYGALEATTAALTADAQQVSESLQKALTEAPAGKKNGSKAAASKEEIVQAAEILRQRGDRVTGPSLAKLLGVAESTGYRYRQELLA